MSSSLFRYDNDLGAVRDSVAEVRKKNLIPCTTYPSLQVTKENEFGRLLLLTFHRFLVDKGIPEEFLKSNYITLRPQLLQVYQRQPELQRRHRTGTGWCGRSDCSRLQDAGERDQSNLLVWVSFRRCWAISWHTAVHQGFFGFQRQVGSDQTARFDHCLGYAKVYWIGAVKPTYTGTAESKFIKGHRYMRGLQNKMLNDSDFVQSVLKNNSRTYARLIAILEGNQSHKN